MRMMQPQDNDDMEFGAMFDDDGPIVCLICKNDEIKHKLPPSEEASFIESSSEQKLVQP